MKFGDALKSTLVMFNVSVNVLSFLANFFTQSRLSRFLNGGSIGTDGLEKIWNALDDEALGFMLRLLLADRKLKVVPGKECSMYEQVERLTPSETAELLDALAKKMRAKEQVKAEAEAEEKQKQKQILIRT